MDALYTATATASGDGRNGHTESDDGLLALDVRIPKEMGGPGGATNPEQLFAAGYAACFHSALKLVGTAESADLTGSEVSTSVSLGALPQGGFGLAVAIVVHAPNLDLETTAALIRKAHDVCPYSNAIKGNVEVTLDAV
ncbi:organic hydroperoxide resistance protein [Pseudofrankia asymbiotica]|uniref:Organic hydroperoxide resistance protein n=1 Tax=Pseudofrankia asymbiotica TaxID=1834516 RepID=A0A1V2I2V2_9ACTN|nr:organic hydroperoxide resistance protein [Pseudofrankia asymbiotica]ONH24437.1 organic hydroperoxide resistance protein [Pseudofrankia asymbiotica]